jgi:hypothetical protein
MSASYKDQFYSFDPFEPPAAGTRVTVFRFVLTDRNGDGRIDAAGPDSVNDSVVTESWPGDTVTVDVPDFGTVTYTGITFYLEDGTRVFTPTDGQVLRAGTFVESTWVSVQGPLLVPDQLGPPCFTPGAMILTPGGERPVEALRPGDLVVTKDRGARPLLWAGARTVCGRGEFAPILIRAGALGNRRDLLVSPQHRMILKGWRAELHAGRPEMLVAAVHLVDGRKVLRAPCARVTYVHFMLDGHEIVFAEGAETESLDPGGELAQANEEIRTLFPGLLPERQVARGRPAARGWEGRAMAVAGRRRDDDPTTAGARRICRDVAGR